MFYLLIYLILETLQLIIISFYDLKKNKNRLENFIMLDKEML